MGWFDGDDSGSDNEEQRRQVVAATQQRQNDEEQDPLEAFMQSLDHAPQASVPTAGNDTTTDVDRSLQAGKEAQSQHQHALRQPSNIMTRMDLQEEEGEDSMVHFKDEGQQYHEHDNEKQLYASSATQASSANSWRAQKARQALDATFQKAGTAHKSSTQSYNQKEHGDEVDGTMNSPHDWNTVGLPQLPKTPATAINSYEPFRKQFWSPTQTSQGVAWRQEHNVTCSLQDVDPIREMTQLKSIVTPGVWKGLEQKGFTTPTTVQSQTWPVVMSGQNVLVTAPTGTGKTLAYLLPAVVHVLDQPHLDASRNETGPIALIIVPTRELALQINKVAKALLTADGGTSKTVIGGQGKYLLWQDLKKNGGMEITVATPGRLLDVLTDTKKRNGVTLDRATMVILDEADRCLQMGFEGQVRQILQALRPDCQSLLLSATMTRRVEQIARAWLRSSFCRIAVGQSGQSSEHVQQHVMVLPDAQAKTTFFLEMVLTLQSVGRCIVFVATREGCERLANVVRQSPKHQNTIKVDTLHGDKHQSDRTRVLRAFAKGDISILIASDLAGRGLDVPQVATVMNYDPAKNIDTHVHRIGRAGRLSNKDGGAQQTGSAYTLLTPKDADFAYALRNSFIRENREISPELQKLADSSRKASGGGGIDARQTARMGRDRSGLGFPQQQQQSPSHSSNLLPNTSQKVGDCSAGQAVEQVEESTDQSSPQPYALHPGEHKYDPFETFCAFLSEYAVPTMEEVTPSSCHVESDMISRILRVGDFLFGATFESALLIAEQASSMITRVVSGPSRRSAYLVMSSGKYTSRYLCLIPSLEAFSPSSVCYCSCRSFLDKNARSQQVQLCKHLLAVTILPYVGFRCKTVETRTDEEFGLLLVSQGSSL